MTVLLDAGADNRADGEWDLMYREVQRNVQREEAPPGRGIDEFRLKVLRATLSILDDWLTKKKMLKPEDFLCRSVEPGIVEWMKPAAGKAATLNTKNANHL